MSVSDEQAIRNLLFLYAERMDGGDLTGVAELFSEAEYGAGEGAPVRGSEAVERIHRALVILHEDGTPRTQHLTTNVAIEVDPATGTARARSRFCVLQGLPGSPVGIVAAGRYEDAFTRRQDGWRFSARRIHLDVMGDLSRHLRLDRLGDVLGS